MDPTSTSEFLRPAEVSPKVADTIMKVLSDFAERHGKSVVAWYHDLPAWCVGPIQVSLVRIRHDVRVEVHNGDIGQQSFPLTPTLHADLHRALYELITLGWANG